MESSCAFPALRPLGAASATAAGGGAVVPETLSVQSLYVRSVSEVPVPDRTRKCPVMLPERFETVWDVAGATTMNVGSVSVKVASGLN